MDDIQPWERHEKKADRIRAYFAQYSTATVENCVVDVGCCRTEVAQAIFSRRWMRLPRAKKVKPFKGKCIWCRFKTKQVTNKLTIAGITGYFHEICAGLAEAHNR